MLGLAMVTAPVFTSCEDMLEEKPYDFISPDDVPDSDDGADMWTTGVYETLHSSMFRYGNMPRPFDYDCDNVSGATWQFDQFGNGNFQGSNNHCDVVWTGMYSVINRANEAIERINEMKNLTARHRDNVLGECYFLKAWAYFMLVRAYGDIPVYSVSVNQSQQYTNSPRIPIKDVYTQTIIPLLDDAKDMLYKNTDTNFQADRVCAASAAGLLAKVYATIASAAMPEGEIVTVKTGPQFVMQNINGTNTKVYTEPGSYGFRQRPSGRLRVVQFARVLSTGLRCGQGCKRRRLRYAQLGILRLDLVSQRKNVQRASVQPAIQVGRRVVRNPLYLPLLRYDKRKRAH